MGGHTEAKTRGVLTDDSREVVGTNQELHSLMESGAEGNEVVALHARMFQSCQFISQGIGHPGPFDGSHLMAILGLIIGDFVRLLCPSLPVLGPPRMKRAMRRLSDDSNL